MQSLSRAGRHAPVAQRIEHLTTDQKVWGSNPYRRADRRGPPPRPGGGPSPSQEPAQPRLWAGSVVAAVGLEQAEPDLADGRVRRYGVPEPRQRDLGSDGDRGRVQQLGDVGAD